MSEREFRLTVVSGPDEGIELKVRPSDSCPVTIGREACDLLFRHDLTVSRVHAEISSRGQDLELLDLGSTNGTHVNGKRLREREAVVIKSGDEFTLGPESIVRLEIQSQRTVRAADTPASQPGPRRRRRSHASDLRADSRPDAAADGSAKTPGSVVELAESERVSERFGHFGVLGQLARSDSDRLDQAIHEPSGRHVALKRFTTPTCTRSVRRAITNETEIGAAWKHPNIVELIEIGEIDGTFFVATSFLPGVSLEMLQRCCAGALEAWIAAFVLRECCSAISYFHDQAKKAHGFLTPRSIVVGQEGQVQLVNYGLPRFEARLTGTDTGEVYRAHEARNGGPLDARSDVCSLGFILYELLTAEPIDLRSKAVLREPDTIRPEIPETLSKIAWRATRLNASKRFMSVKEMGDALSAALDTAQADFGSTQVAAWMAKHCPAELI